ncbi:VWA domain-containing protein [Streptomyces sp. NBC_01268]|uniref:VWA domain-containing protein n=1 Tax=Streptomyces sp. NBC_01268 TaxID=2903806 RepID=UPI002E3801D6|nr:VWA domain-containing protein [Streptomyces sp. NBC_01268]
MGIRSLLRKVFGRDRANDAEESSAPATSVPAQSSGPGEAEGTTTSQPPSSEESPAERAAADLVAASFDNPQVPAARRASDGGEAETAPAEAEAAPAEATAEAETAPAEAEATVEVAAEAPAEAEAAPAEAEAPVATGEAEETAAASDAADADATETVDADASESSAVAETTVDADTAGTPATADEAEETAATGDVSHAPAEREPATADTDAAGPEAAADADTAEATATGDSDTAEPEAPSGLTVEVPAARTADEEPSPAEEPVAADAPAAQIPAARESAETAEPTDTADAPDAPAALDTPALAEAPAEEPATDTPVEAPAETPAEEPATAETPAETPVEAPVEAPAEEPATAEAPAEEPAAGTPALSLAKVKAVAPHLADAYKAAGAVLKKQGLAGARAAVYLVVDRSGSMRPYFKDGSVQRLAEQTVALAAHLSEDATVTAVFFSTDIDGTAELRPADLTPDRIETVNATLGRMGRTNYHRAVEEVLAHHEKNDPARPALVVFQTDGAPESRTAATQALAEAADRPVHWRFTAWGEEDGKAFDYLRKLPATAPRTGVHLAGPAPLETPHAAFYRGLLADAPAL